jgi:hypothetical protein
MAGLVVSVRAGKDTDTDLLVVNRRHATIVLARHAEGKGSSDHKHAAGVNELHHTLANWLVDYATDECKAFPVHSLVQGLLEIANQYRIEGLLSSAVEFARTRNPSPKR